MVKVTGASCTPELHSTLSSRSLSRGPLRFFRRCQLTKCPSHTMHHASRVASRGKDGWIQGPFASITTGHGDKEVTVNQALGPEAVSPVRPPAEGDLRSAQQLTGCPVPGGWAWGGEQQWSMIPRHHHLGWCSLFHKYPLNIGGCECCMVPWKKQTCGNRALKGRCLVEAEDPESPLDDGERFVLQEKVKQVALGVQRREKSLQ